VKNWIQVKTVRGRRTRKLTRPVALWVRVGSGIVKSECYWILMMMCN